MEKRTIKTQLKGKDEVFNLLALGEAVQLPVLLLGEPGVGKTQALLDYAASKYNYRRDLVRSKTFMIELDEGTKTSEIKGRVDMKALLEEKKYETKAPIADAEFIMINEVDKGTSGVRNTLLSVMREKALFYGDTVKKCNWQVFAGSCNIIPQEEIENPFWDRFILTLTVERVGSDVMKGICNEEALKVHTLDINIPSTADIEKENVNTALFNKFVDTIYSTASDRTIYALKDIIKAVKLIYTYDDKQAIIYVCSLVAPAALADISSKLETKRENNVATLLSQLPGILEAHNDSYAQIFLHSVLTEITALAEVNSYKTRAEQFTKDVITCIETAAISTEQQMLFKGIVAEQSLKTTLTV
jgi:MoxR-like ATPase